MHSPYVYTWLQVALNRFDLFHAHFFYSKDNKLGLLFHAKEYPAQCNAFPYFLGFCQNQSTLRYTDDGMAFRNYLWYNVRLHVLCAVLFECNLQFSVEFMELCLRFFRHVRVICGQCM
jgi:hypothetical protein